MATLDVGRPFLGYYSRGTKHEAPPGYITADSRDWMLLPRHGVWKRRAGSAIAGGDSLAAGAEVAGLLEAKWSAKARQMFELQSASISSGAPTYACYYSVESTTLGQLYFRDSNSAVSDPNQVLGSRFASDYPLLGATNPNRFRMVPLWSEHDHAYTRCATKLQRRLLGCGTRRLMGVGNYIFFPSAKGTPFWWDTQFNDSGVTTNHQQIYPAGQIPPLMVPNLTTGTVGSAAAADPWTGDDRFIYSVAFRRDDDSISRPFVPRNAAAVGLAGTNPKANGAGYIDALNSGSTTTYYKYITWANIPIGPPGTKSRILLRTVKVSSTGSSGALSPSPATLGIVDEIPDNTTTTYKDYGGALTPLLDATNIRFDHKLPSRARTWFSFDGHYAACGKLKQNPAALFVFQRATSAASVNNYSPTATAFGSTELACGVRHNQVAATRQTEFATREGANYASAPTPLNTGTTLQDLLDIILGSAAATTTTAYGDWKGQIAPGANPYATTDNLQITQVYANFSTTNGNPRITVQNGGDGAAGSLAAVVVGMKIDGAGIPAGSYVGTVTATYIDMVDASNLAVNASATANPVALKVGHDFGDTYPGEQRVYSNSIYGALYFTKAYLDLQFTDDRAIDFTGADPGHAKYAANNWYTKNRRSSVPRKAGLAMGGFEVQNGAMACYSRGLGTLSCTRGGKTNADDDWNLQFLYGARDTISYQIVQGNAWGARLTSQGIAVNDGQREVIISEALFDPSDKTGILAYEVQKAKSSTLLDSDDHSFHMMVAEGRLYISYRISANVRAVQVYDFSPGVGASGLDEVLKPDGTPYGWGAPYLLSLTCMTEVQASDGVHFYGALDTNAGTADGRIDEFETGTSDNSTAIVPIGYHAMTHDAALRKMAVHGLSIAYKKAGTGFKVGLSSDKNRTAAATYLALASSGTDELTTFADKAIGGSASPREVIELVFTDDGSSSAPEFHGAQVLYETLAGAALG